MDTKLKPGFWHDSRILELDPEAKLTVIWLLTHSGLELAGISRHRPKLFSFDTGLGPEILSKTLEQLPTMFKTSGDYIWAVRYVRYQFGRGESLIKNGLAKCIVNSISQAPRDLQIQFYAQYPELATFAGAHNMPLPPPPAPPSGGGAPGSHPPPSHLEGGVGGVREGEREREGDPPLQRGCGGDPSLEPVIPTEEEVFEHADAQGIPRSFAQEYVDYRNERGKAAWLYRGKVFNWRLELINRWRRDSKRRRWAEEEAARKDRDFEETALAQQIAEGKKASPKPTHTDGTRKWVKPE